MAKTKELEEIVVNEVEVVAPQKQEKQKAIYIFVTEFKTQSKTYFSGDDCFQENEKVIAYLLKNKIIKKK